LYCLIKLDQISLIYDVILLKLNMSLILQYLVQIGKILD